MSTSNLYDITVAEFSSYEEARKTVSEGQRLLVSMSKFCTKLIASQFSEFEDTEYSRQEIEKIIDNNDVKTFQSICPLYFKSMNIKMNEEQEKFFVENITDKQLEYIPLTTFKILEPNSIKQLANRLKNVDDTVYHKTVYLVHEPNQKENEKYEFYLVKDYQMNAVAMIQFKYVVRNDRFKQRDESQKEIFNKETITLREIAQFLGANLQYVRIAYFEDKDSMFAKHLKSAKKQTTNAKNLEHEVTTRSFIELLKACCSDRTVREETIRMMDGVYDWRVLAKENCSEGSLTYVNVAHAFRVGKLRGFKLSDRIIRFSRQDFKEFLRNRKDKKSYTHAVIQFPLNISKEDQEKILSNYIEEKELYTRLAFSTKNIDDLRNFRSVPMVQRARAEMTLYTYRGSSHLYFRKDDANEFVSRMYGYEKNGKFVTGKQADVSKIKDVYRFDALLDRLQDRYPSLSKMEIRMLVQDGICRGQIPYMNTGERRKLFIFSDVTKVVDVKVSLM